MALLCDEWALGQPTPAGLDAAEEWAWGLDGFPTIGEAWNLMRAQILAPWVEQHPGTRPTCWWTFDSPAPRVRLGGVGDRLSEVMAHSPSLSFGLPAEGWLTCALVETYRVRLHTQLWNRVQGRAGVPLDPDNPPTFESQTTYLRRLTLLTEHEDWLWGAGQLDLEPERVELDDEDADPESSEPVELPAHGGNGDRS
jgi:hypothetical protein